MTQKSLIKIQISPIKNSNFDKPSRNLSKRTKVKILEKKFFWISLKKNLVPRMLSHRGNIRTSKFWRKSKEKKRKIFSKIYEGHIRIWFRSKKYSKLSHACVPLNKIGVFTEQNGATVPIKSTVKPNPLSSAMDLNFDIFFLMISC
jgi:hypothetical protein